MINFPIYTINRVDIEDLFKIGEEKSKLTANIRIEDPSFDFTMNSSLYLFAFHKKGPDSGDRRFIKYAVAKSSVKVSFDYYPFLVTNTEKKIDDILEELKKPKHRNYKSLAFVPELEEQTLPDGDIIYSLIFTINSSLVYKAELDSKANFVDMSAFLTKVTSLNPCPPARPAEYR
jgi:hypothetical protein